MENDRKKDLRTSMDATHKPDDQGIGYCIGVKTYGSNTSGETGAVRSNAPGEIDNTVATTKRPCLYQIETAEGILGATEHK